MRLLWITVLLTVATALWYTLTDRSVEVVPKVKENYNQVLIERIDRYVKKIDKRVAKVEQQADTTAATEEISALNEIRSKLVAERDKLADHTPDTNLIRMRIADLIGELHEMNPEFRE